MRKTAAEKRAEFMAEWAKKTPREQAEETARTIVRSHGGNVQMIRDAILRSRA